MLVRPETPHDIEAIRRIHVEAFQNHPISQQTEHLIVDALRAADALPISLVAVLNHQVVGHIAFSAAQIGDGVSNWYLLGPVAVLPSFQRLGIGRALVEAGLGVLRTIEAHGCALVGNPDFYTRFGFTRIPGVACGEVPDEYVLCLRISGPLPHGELVHHPAFCIKPNKRAAVKPL